MNFLFFPGGSFIGGTEVVVQSLMIELNKMGHGTLAIISGWNNGDYPTRLRESRLAFGELKLGRFYRSRPLWTLDGLRNLPAASSELRRLAREFQPEIAVHVDAQILLLGSLILPNVRNVLYQHTQATGLGRFPSIRSINRRLDRVICVSEFVAATARAARLDPAKIAVVPNGVALPAAPNLGRRPQIVTLGMVGRVSLQKQHMALIAAIGLVKKRQPLAEFRLKIIGTEDQPYAQEVRALSRQLGVEGIVEWAGFVADRDAIYRDLDIVVAPAVNEAFGMTVAEAAAYGLPVVAARSGGFPEMVIDGQTGFLFDVGDVERFAAVLDRLIVDACLREQLGRAGRLHVERHFALRRMAERFAEVLS